MARRRFQSPQPFKEGQFWWLRVWDTNQAGSRKRQRIKLALASMPMREEAKIAEEKLRPVNQGLALTGSAMNFHEFVTSTYIPTYLPLLSSSTQDSYRGVISRYLSQLAVPQNFTRNLAGAGRRESQGCSRANETFSNLHHDGHLCTDRSCVTAAGNLEAFRVCKTRGCRFTVHYGPIKRGCRCSKVAAQVGSC
jgi:hypothetical protein